MEMTALEKAIFIAKILDDKKALDVTVLKVEQSSSVWEYFVIATGQSNTQIKALANEVEAKMEEKEESSITAKEGIVAWSPFILIFILLMITSKLCPPIQNAIAGIKDLAMVTDLYFHTTG